MGKLGFTEEKTATRRSVTNMIFTPATIKPRDFQLDERKYIPLTANQLQESRRAHLLGTIKKKMIELVVRRLENEEFRSQRQKLRCTIGKEAHIRRGLHALSHVYIYTSSRLVPTLKLSDPSFSPTLLQLFGVQGADDQQSKQSATVAMALPSSFHFILERRTPSYLAR